MIKVYGYMSAQMKDISIKREFVADRRRNGDEFPPRFVGGRDTGVEVITAIKVRIICNISLVYEGICIFSDCNGMTKENCDAILHVNLIS